MSKNKNNKRRDEMEEQQEGSWSKPKVSMRIQGERKAKLRAIATHLGPNSSPHEVLEFALNFTVQNLTKKDDAVIDRLEELAVTTRKMHELLTQALAGDQEPAPVPLRAWLDARGMGSEGAQVTLITRCKIRGSQAGPSFEISRVLLDGKPVTLSAETRHHVQIPSLHAELSALMKRVDGDVLLLIDRKRSQAHFFKRGTGGAQHEKLGVVPL